MGALASDLRRQLENVCVKARDVAEAAARSVLMNRAVDAAEPFPHFTAGRRKERNRLRARGRQAGDFRLANKTQTLDQLTQELAYEYWHRMLFARFLAENHLLMHPDGVAVSLEECDELAKAAEARRTALCWRHRYASRMLPQIFRTDDVLLEIRVSPRSSECPWKSCWPVCRQRPSWRTTASVGCTSSGRPREKTRSTEAAKKLTARTLPAVTQLFTEHYMVQFLLHNTIGAWLVGRGFPA